MLRLKKKFVDCHPLLGMDKEKRAVSRKIDATSEPSELNFVSKRGALNFSWLCFIVYLC